ncbi:MAG TPA: glycosyl hydrolase [Candidatus Limnocylindrales bacterium]|nr:glycosyl hydrolase [Candidatus Limnocylindrales bacterium]
MRRRCTSRLAFLLLALVLVDDGLAQIQIVNCDAPVQSRKRGIAVNTLSTADFQVLAPGVSWFYDWGINNWTVPSGVAMSYIPMVWSDYSGYQSAISSYLAAGNRPWRVFAINEPNNTGQANMTPAATATAFEQVQAICNPYNIPVICPHMATGSQESFLATFLSDCGSTPPPGMATHSYAGYGDLTYWTGLMHGDFPTQTVWVTEFNPSGISGGISSSAQVLANLIPSVDYCERTPWIEGYSWFMSRINGDPYDSLLSTSGVLTAAGQAYVQMPVHETNLFYRIPGQLQAARYVTMNQMSIAPTTDTNGLADMITTAAGGSLNYNIQVDTAGSYPLNFRVSGTTGLISVYEGGTLLGTANVPTASWSTVSTTVTLPAGTQTLQVVLSANGQHFNWMQFQPVNGPVAVPTGISATAGNAQVALSWSPSAGATSYNVQSSTNQGGAYTSIATPTTTSYTNTGLANGTTYYYVVSATDGVNVSSNSIEVSATPVYSHANLALNQPVTASTYQASSPYCPAIYAVDGNLATRWASVWTNIPQWIYVDLGATYNITEVELYWEAAYATSFQIQVSPDAANWTNIYSTTTGGGGVQDLTGLTGLLPGTGRYVRMYATKRATTYGYSLWEFQVYGSPVPTNQPPVLAAVPDQTILAGRTLLVTNLASDPNIPPLPLTFSLSNPPAGASINATNGVFSWRPAIAQSPSTQTVSVVVSDNGLPPLTATQSFNVTVNQPAAPTLSTASITNGQLGFWISGVPGPDYTIEVSTNLTSWTPVTTSSSPSLPYFWADTNSLSFPSLFYRVMLGP